MSELAERARKLRAKTWTKIGFDTNEEDFTQRYDKLIEQALLAERRLAMETAADMIEYICPDHGLDCPHPHTKQKNEIAAKLRAAAEKEVGTK